MVVTWSPIHRMKKIQSNSTHIARLPRLGADIVDCRDGYGLPRPCSRLSTLALIEPDRTDHRHARRDARCDFFPEPSPWLIEVAGALRLRSFRSALRMQTGIRRGI